VTDAREAEGRKDPLPASRARRRCDPAELRFETTAELEPLEGMLGQARAEEAMRFGVGVRHRGFNLFVLGPAGVGKHRLVADTLETRAAREPVPDDWVYVHNFEDADRPRAMRLPAGRGAALEEAMERVVEELGEAIRAAFESDEFRNRRRVIEQKVESRHEEAFSELAEKAEEKGLRLLRTPMGFAFAPVEDGEVLNPDQFGKLPAEKQEAFKKHLEEMEEELRGLMQQIPKWQREARGELKALQREVAGYAVANLMREVRAPFADLEHVTAWLEAVEKDAVEHAPAFVEVEEREGEGPEAMVQKALSRGVGGPLSRYRVNLFVDRRAHDGAPVVHEDHPTLDRLVGRVDQRAQLGALVSDFTLIKPGALHRANGGYLVLDARRLLGSPSAYDSLKRALRRQELEIESLGKILGLSTGHLEPEPIPLDLKVVLVGERRLYYLLSALDPDFDQLFKVAADFEDDVPWDGRHLTDFARLVAGVAKAEDLLPVHRSAVARMVEHAARAAEDAKKITTNLTRVCDVLREADWRARERGAAHVEREDVQGAIEARRRRDGRLRERLLERFADGTLRLETAGERVGQVNGLSVLEIGHTRFGRPNRITCRVRLGKGEVVDIEREVELGGPLHSKGVMILSGFLGAHYGLERPLSLSASLVFEQSYGGVDGDSASLAELCALLSALADVPIQQRFALTGSVDQMGYVQAIGGVNEKIEGFFDVCRDAGLDGSHGVIIPASNVQHLMLREDVIEAIDAGKLAVHEARHVDEVIELLTGVAAGARGRDGSYPEDTFHGRVERRLAHFAERAKEFAVPLRGGEGAAPASASAAAGEGDGGAE
jgi:lon-related putative ATP-dependent protease